MGRVGSPNVPDLDDSAADRKSETVQCQCFEIRGKNAKASFWHAAGQHAYVICRERGIPVDGAGGGQQMRVVEEGHRSDAVLRILHAFGDIINKRSLRMHA